MREHFKETARPERAEDGYRIPYTFVILEARR
jgi:hypothetical protein